MTKHIGSLIAALCISALLYVGMYHALPRWADSLPVSQTETILAGQ